MENKNKTLLDILFSPTLLVLREFADFKDFDRFLGISSISRILKEYLPWNSKIASGVTFSSSGLIVVVVVVVVDGGIPRDMAVFSYSVYKH